MADNEASLLIRIKQAGGEVLDQITGSIGEMADKAAAVATALIGFGVAAVHAFRESEKSSNELTQAMVNQGMYTTELKEKYDTLAKALQAKTQFDDDAILSAQATLQSYAGQTEVTAELTMATLNLAAAKGMDLKSAAEMVGKTIGTETNALAKQGVEIDNVSGKTERMAAVVSALGTKYGGQAEAAARGLGSMEQLKNAAGDFLEKIGGQMAPFISFFTKQLLDFTTSLEKNKDVFNGINAVIDFTAKSLVVLKNLIAGTAEVLGSGLAAAVESVSLAMHGKFGQAKDVMAAGLDDISNLAKERALTLGAELNAIDDQRALADQQKREQELADIQRSEENKSMVAKQEADKRLEISKKAKEAQKKIDDDAQKKKDEDDKKILAARASFLGHMSSLQDSNNKLLAAAGKAAAIAQITIATAQAAADGYKWGMAIGGPGVAAAFSGLAKVAGAAQIAQVAGVKLAEGGIVRASHGGTPAIIGEGGRDEAVIPLDDPSAQERLGGGRGSTIIFNGPILGDESQAMEFARAIDKNLLKLRQTGQSVAFETDVF
jgi:hypothetical protein